MEETKTPGKEKTEKEKLSYLLEQCLKSVFKFHEKDVESKESHQPYVKEPKLSKKEQRMFDLLVKQMQPGYDCNKGMIMAMAIVLTKEEKAEKAKAKKEKNTHVALTDEQKEIITKETKTKLDLMFTLPPPPQVAISAAMGLHDMNASALCNYIADKFPRIAAVPAFSSAVPNIGIAEGIYELLFPFANMSRLDGEQMIARETYVVQLRNNFTTTVNSIISICNGNLMMFALTGIKAKGKAIPNNKRLAAPVFRLNTKKGRGTIYISCKKDKNSKGYIVYYGVGEYDPATWKYAVGSSRILIEGLTPKDDLNFIMVAIGKSKTGFGYWPDPQGRTVPSN